VDKKKTEFTTHEEITVLETEQADQGVESLIGLPTPVNHNFFSYLNFLEHKEYR